MKQTFIERKARRHVNSMFYIISIFPLLFSLENRQAQNKTRELKFKLLASNLHHILAALVVECENLRKIFSVS